jgi:radical SAM superfamily enzyme YgiQ (UPF0313 family)
VSKLAINIIFAAGRAHFNVVGIMINRVLLIDVEVFEDKDDPGTLHYSHHPVGLLYLVSAARKSFPDIQFKVFHTYTYKDPLKRIEELLFSYNPDIVGLRALSTAKSTFKLVADKIRELKPELPIIGGGPYSSASYAEILLNGCVDIAVIGEGEDTFVELIDRLMESDSIPGDIRGTAVLRDEKVFVNDPRPLIKDIDTIVFPDYSYIDLKDYVGIRDHTMQDTSKPAYILSSRGCPYGCFYCHQIFGKRIRRRSAENVVAEMRERKESLGISDFVFLDDLFNVPMQEAKKVLSLITKELPGVRLNFPNGLRVDQMDEEMLDLFEKAGTVEMALAVETATPRLQKMMGKNLDLKKAEKVIHAASKRFITRIFYMIGFPTETFDEAMDTVRFAASFEYVAQPTLSMLRLYNNSRLFNILKPTEEQFAAIAHQEKKVLHLQMFGEVEFYGDFFPDDKVPLKSDDIKELLYIWMRDVLTNPLRVQKSHQVLKKYLDEKTTIEFYASLFNRSKFNEKDLQNLLKY